MKKSHTLTILHSYGSKTYQVRAQSIIIHFARMSEAARQAIVAHMNRDHRLALEDYLYVYGKVPITSDVRFVRMLSIDLDCMTLQFTHKGLETDIEKIILLEPPLKDWNEARPRLVEMAHTAASKRGLSTIQVNDMSYPSTVPEYALICAVFLPFLCYKYRSLLYWLPLPSALLKFLDNDLVLGGVILFAVVTHFIEVITILRPKLIYYRVPTDFLIEWYVFGMLEGYPCIKRLERLAGGMLKHQK